MKKILLANGCSMTYGLELFDDENKVCLDNEARERTAWPGRVKDILGFDEVYNLGVNSGSNDRILRTTISKVYEILETEKDCQLFVIIGWSGANRREFYIDGEWWQVVPYHDQTNVKLNDLTKIYREVAMHDEEHSLRFLTEVVSLQSFLKYNHIPYLFFDAIAPSKEQIINGRDAAKIYARNIDCMRYIGFNDINGCMADILKVKVPIWNGRHPSPEGHDWWARYLVEYIQENDLMNNELDECKISDFTGNNVREVEEVTYIYT